MCFLYCFYKQVIINTRDDLSKFLIQDTTFMCIYNLHYPKILTAESA
jgi:hypothetical protein